MESTKPEEKNVPALGRGRMLLIAMGMTAGGIGLSILATGWAPCAGIAMGSVFMGMALVLAGWDKICTAFAAINRNLRGPETKKQAF
ncbi:MAG: hypothetical protein ACK4NR_10375 [Micavibrio sp.]